MESSLASLGTVASTGKVSMLKKKTKSLSEREKQVLQELGKNPLKVHELIKTDKKSLESLLNMGMVKKEEKSLPLTDAGKKALSSNS